MTTSILSPTWAGQTGAPIDPDTIRFKAVQAPKRGACDGCLFADQASKVCIRASAIAVAAGFPDCDDPSVGQAGTVIYVLDDSDPRQLPLLEKGH